jgi:hypothetical protein
MPFHRALGALALAAVVLAGCSKSADKGKTEDQLVAAGFTQDQAKCITDDVWEKIPKKDLDKLTDKDSTLNDDQKKVVNGAAVTCARDKVEAQIKDAVTGSNSAATPEQVDCIVGKLSDDELVSVMSGDTDALTTAVTSCVSSS